MNLHEFMHNFLNRIRSGVALVILNEKRREMVKREHLFLMSAKSFIYGHNIRQRQRVQRPLVYQLW